MSELRPGTPARRPETARPREEAVPRVTPPTPAELDAIERHLVALPRHEGADVTTDETLGVTFVDGPGSGPDTTYAGMPRWDGATWRQSLEAVRGRMRDAGTWPSLLLSDRLDGSRQIAGELERLGWMPITRETVMWVGHASVVPHLDPSMRIEAVQPRSLATHEELERHIFGIGSEAVERRRAALAAALETGRVRAWVVWVGDEPVAVARLSQGEGTAALQGVGVVAERRGQGYGTLITTIATRAGMATGNRIVWLSVHEGNGSALGVYSRLGFERAFGWTRWLVTEAPQRD